LHISTGDGVCTIAAHRYFSLRPAVPFSKLVFMTQKPLGFILMAIAFAISVCNLPGQDSPRERLLFDFGWKFHLGEAPDSTNKLDFPEVTDLAKTQIKEIGREGEANVPDPVATNLGGNISFVQPGFDDRGWRQLDLPHDWAVEMPFDPKAEHLHGFKPVGTNFVQNDIGWYRRTFDLPESDRGKTLWLEFDGVYRNSLVWLNGHCLGRHLSGYSGFRYDISKYANYGGKNELVVRVDATRFEGWFYEGAGIYRHVWLEKTGPLAIAPDGIFVWSQFKKNVPKGHPEIHIQVNLLNWQTNAAKITLKNEIQSPDGEEITTLRQKLKLPAASEKELNEMTRISKPELWSPDSPSLYKLVTTIESGGKVLDQKETEFGIRTVAFATNGFLLNGKRYEIQGTCNHQDHAGVGSAIPDDLQDFRVAKLKEMGCNAIRTSHNPPTPELLDACDRMGLLVMDENRRMDTNAYELNELRNFVLRDRNHPGVFIWSLGNEEAYIQGTRGTNKTITPEIAQAAGKEVTTAMQNVVHELDPTRLCTVAMNGGWGYGISTVLDVQGFNYRTHLIDGFRAKFPHKLTIGTETASTRMTRGIYADDKTNGFQTAYATNGTELAEKWWPYYATHPFTSGGFVWTGFDYRGEPTPYRWPCISSQFGIMDTCGFPKDIYYYYQSWWTSNTVLHILPHWNWPDKIGKDIDVRVFSNCKQVELFLNGQSLGKQTMQTNSFLDWTVKYEPGTLIAKGYDDDGTALTEIHEDTTGDPGTVEMEPDRTLMDANGESLSIVSVSVRDLLGHVVPTSTNLVHFAIQGPGKIIGVGNGDPGCHEPDKYLSQSGWQRSVFNGYAQVIVQSTKFPGEIVLTASADGLQPETVYIQSQSCTPRPNVP
jgi:beta-galactosidase